MNPPHLTGEDIAQGLQSLELDIASCVMVHTSLSAFGHVEGGAGTVCRALLRTCGTVMMPAFTFDSSGLPFAPPGLLRPNNAYFNAQSWDEFDTSVHDTRPFSSNAPVDDDIGVIPETFRHLPDIHRSCHPLMSFAASGIEAIRLVDSQQLVSPLAPIQVLADLDGDILLLGVGHWANTAIHLGEQITGRSRFWRYGVIADDIWVELPNLPGSSSGFASLDDALNPVAQTMIGSCLARRFKVRDVLRRVKEMIEDDPAALLDLQNLEDERVEAAWKQRLAVCE